MESTTKITVELAPFIDSVDKVFTVMLQSTLEQIDVDQLDDEGAAKIVSSTAVIGLKGAAFWTLSRVIPAPAGSAITRRFLRTDEDLSSADITDALDARATMIAGGARAELSTARNKDISISLPTVVTGSDCHLEHPAGSEILAAAWRSELGNFTTNVTSCNL